MASDYTVVAQYETVEYLGGTQTRDVIAVGIVTKPHNVYREIRIPKKEYTAALVGEEAYVAAIEVEGLFAFTGVAGVSWAMAPTADGELEDTFTIYVQSSSTNSSSSIVVPYTQLTTDHLTSVIGHLRTQLDDAESL